MSDTNLTDTLAAWRAVHEAATEGEWRFHAASVSQPDGIWCSGSSITDAAPYYPSAPTATDMRAITTYHNTYAALLEVARGLAEWQADLAKRSAASGHSDVMLHALHAAVSGVLKPLAPLTAAAEREA